MSEASVRPKRASAEPSVQTRLVVLVLWVLMPTAVLGTAAAVYEWYRGLQATERELNLQAQRFASDIVREIDVAKATLYTLATSPSLATGDWAAFHEQMSLAPRPEGARVVLSTASGDMILNTQVPRGTSLPKRGDIDIVRRVFTTGLAQVSDLYVSPRTGERLFAVDVPVPFDGVVRYDLTLAFPPPVLSDVLRRQRLPEDRNAAILDSHGLIMARSRLIETFLGKPVAAKSLEALARGEGVFTSVNAEGVEVFAANARVPGTSWFVIVSTPRSFIVAGLGRSLALIAGGIVSLTAIGLLIATFYAKRIARPLARLAAAASALGRGEAPPPVPPGLREASQAGMALLQSATALQERQRERDAAAAALRASAGRLSRLLATTPTGIIEMDASGTYVYANAAAERILGGPGASLIGRRYDDPCWNLALPDGGKLSSEDVPARLALRGRPVVNLEHSRTALDGRRVVVLGEVVAVRSEAGRLEGALVAFQDVTARHHAVQALRESEARFRQVADSAPALIWMCGNGARLSFVNEHHRRMFGDNDMLGHGWRSVVASDDLAAFLAAIGPAFRRRAAFKAELRVRDHAGRLRWLSCEGVPRLDGDGRWAGYTGCSVDITEARGLAEMLEASVAERTAALTRALEALRAEAAERARAEEALRQSQKMEAVGQLTGGIAHDFNNMLQGVSGSLELMLRRVQDGRIEEATRFVDSARVSVDRAAALTHRLLAFARRQALQPRLIDPDGLVSSVADMLQSAVGPKIHLLIQRAEGRRGVLCDPNQLESALLNLAINARDAMPSGGRLVIGTRDVTLGADDLQQDGLPPGPYVEVCVSDNGAGMDGTTMRRAFEPFFTTKPLGQGTGLGLSQIYGFVKQSGGMVRLDSAPGRGTSVRLYLPWHAPDAAVGEAGAATLAPRAANETLLLVEDEEAVRDVTADYLRELGYTVLEAAEGNTALKTLDSGIYIDALVTDVGLPGELNGRQVADAARTRRPALPVLFVTGYAGTAFDGQLAPGMEVIGKPFKLAMLASRLRDLLDRTNAVAIEPAA